MRPGWRQPRRVRLVLDPASSARVLARLGPVLAWERARRRRARWVRSLRLAACALLPLLVFAMAVWQWR